MASESSTSNDEESSSSSSSSSSSTTSVDDEQPAAVAASQIVPSGSPFRRPTTDEAGKKKRRERKKAGHHRRREHRDETAVESAAASPSTPVDSFAHEVYHNAHRYLPPKPDEIVDEEEEDTASGDSAASSADLSSARDYCSRELALPSADCDPALHADIVAALLHNERVRFAARVSANIGHELKSTRLSKKKASRRSTVSEAAEAPAAAVSMTASSETGSGGEAWRDGTVVVSNYRLLFVPDEYSHLVIPSYVMPAASIHKVKKAMDGKRHMLEVHGKDGRLLEFDLERFHAKPKEARRSLYAVLVQYALPASGYQTFAFVHGRTVPFDVTAFRFDAVAEYQRIFNIPAPSHCPDADSYAKSLASSHLFRFCSLNCTPPYGFSPTYPLVFVVPSSMHDDELLRIGAFRSRSRVPACVWRHPSNGATISRCAQPMVGLSGIRNHVDELYVSRLRRPGQRHMHIIDVRPKANAVANKLKGGGFEAAEAGNKEAAYADAALVFAPVENIHVMRHALVKLWKLARTTSPNDPGWFSALLATQWLDYTHSVLLAGWKLAELVDAGDSVLVHCSDGWDRTAQTVALGELLLDPYYRTVEGFMILIEKEWLSFGHMFARRVGHGAQMSDPADSQRAPIFLQWIDAVWQIWTQSPRSFEFNEHFLITILEHLTSCRFGTFLGDCERERVTNKINENSDSLWDYMLARRSHYVNAVYNPDEPRFLKINLSPHAVRYWKEFHQHRRMDLPQSLCDRPIAELSAAASSDASVSSPAAPSAFPGIAVHTDQQPPSALSAAAAAAAASSDPKLSGDGKKSAKEGKSGGLRERIRNRRMTKSQKRGAKDDSSSD